MLKSLIVLFCILITIITKGQEVETHKYEFEKLNIDLRKDFNNAEFIADYFFTEGISLGDRYSYEIIVTDSIITLMFNAPEFGCYNYLKYVKRIQLEPEEVDTLKMVIKKANLKQIHQGIAHWDGSMYTRELLILKLDSLYIAGGQTYGPIGTYSEDESEKKVRKKVEKDKRDSSSISGDYDSIINLLRKYFKNIDELYKDAYKY
jgi:hypothetical protein